MSRPLLLGLAALVFLPAAHILCAQGAPTLDGYVTRAGTAENFDVDGTHITCNPVPTEPGLVCTPYVYGQHLLIYGKRDKRSHTIAADRIEAAKDPAETHITGFALIDGILSPTLIRADGYAMELTPATKQAWNPPLTASAKPEVNQWIEYEGLRHGRILTLKQISFFAGIVTAKEQNLRNKTDFDASAVTEEDRQSGASKFFRGVDYKRIPAVHDPDLQTRLNNIGQRLIPKWQKDLPVGDPNKIDFQFQLVDAKWSDCMTMPSGVILVPAYIADKLDDDELATVLADNIATALEKQTFRYSAECKAMLASSVAGDVAGLFVPGLSLLPIAGNATAAHTIKKHLREQSGRVSLVLLHDAGFDIRKAPLAWWELSARQPDFMTRPIPYRAAYLFSQLATEWSSGSPILSSGM
ncbi:MAG TPA: hypothetical protein VFA99_05105 [Acidobacteriaceae bacterium]|nr:hypothetical protein [Acidobacteriaceae bacterium]